MKKLEIEEIVSSICKKFEHIKEEYIYLVDCYMHFDDYLHSVEKYNFVYIDDESIKYITYEYREIELEPIDELSYKVISYGKEEFKEKNSVDFEVSLSPHSLQDYKVFKKKINGLKNIKIF